MKKNLCSLLVLTLLAAAVPVAAADKPDAGAPTAKNAAPLGRALEQAGPTVTLTAAPVATAATGSVTTALPRTGSSRIRNQGGGGMGMAIGLVSTLVGVGATVYMVKQMKKNTDDAK